MRHNLWPYSYCFLFSRKSWSFVLYIFSIFSLASANNCEMLWMTYRCSWDLLVWDGSTFRCRGDREPCSSCRVGCHGWSDTHSSIQDMGSCCLFQWLSAPPCVCQWRLDNQWLHLDSCLLEVHQCGDLWWRVWVQCLHSLREPTFHTT